MEKKGPVTSAAVVPARMAMPTSSRSTVLGLIIAGLIARRVAVKGKQPNVFLRQEQVHFCHRCGTMSRQCPALRHGFTILHAREAAAAH